MSLHHAGRRQPSLALLLVGCAGVHNKEVTMPSLPDDFSQRPRGLSPSDTNHGGMLLLSLTWHLALCSYLHTKQDEEGGGGKGWENVDESWVRTAPTIQSSTQVFVLALKISQRRWWSTRGRSKGCFLVDFSSWEFSSIAPETRSRFDTDGPKGVNIADFG